jgi:hypothetical protein
MNKPYNMEDHFDSFASKEISFEELLSHNKNMNVQELNEQLQLHLAAKRAIRKYAVMHKNYASVGELHSVQELMAPVRSISARKAIQWTMRIAASVALLIGLYVAQYVVFYTPEKMYKNNFSEYSLNNERGASETAVNEMVEAFRKKDYSRVINLYSLPGGKTNREKFLAGYSQLELNDAAAATLLFNDIISTNRQMGTGYFQDEAEYYLAMALLKQNKKEEAHELLDKIYANKEHTFNESVSSWMLFRLKW